MKKYFGVGHKSLYFSHFSNVLVERNWNAKENFEYSFIQIGFSKTCQLLIISSDNIICKVLHLQCGNSLAVVGSMWGNSRWPLLPWLLSAQHFLHHFLLRSHPASWNPLSVAFMSLLLPYLSSPEHLAIALMLPGYDLPQHPPLL